MADDGCPGSAQDASDDGAWAAQQLQRPELAQRPDRKTVGIWYDEDGTESDPVLSGLDANSGEAERILKESGVAMPSHGRYAAIADVETKVAVQMRISGVKHGVLLINNPKGVCEGGSAGDYSCTRAVPIILPVGYTLAVWWPGADRAKILVGRSPK